MRQPTNRYRYIITNRLGTLQAAPLGESNFTIEWEKDTEGRQDYRKNLPSKIVFTGPVYQNLLKLERSIYRCDPIDMSVERLCSAGGVETWELWFSGRMSLNEGDWNIDRCEVEIKMEDIPAAACLADGKSQELNLLSEVTTRRSVYASPTNIEVETVEYSDTHLDPDACDAVLWEGVGDPTDGGWNYYYSLHVRNAPTDCSITTRWAREVVYIPFGGTVPGSEWILVSDGWPGGDRKYARPPRMYNCVYTNPDFSSPTQITEYNCRLLGDEGSNILIDNGLPLEDILEMFMDKFCPGTTVISNFFQINPDVPTGINYVTGQPTKTNHLTFFQKSDVKRPGAVENATKLPMTYDKFMQILVTSFNLGWTLEAGILRIEHVSYFSAALGLDLTAPRYAAFVNAINRYSYKNEDIPIREEFKWMEATDGDFKGLPIYYTKCVTGARNVKTNTVDRAMTDVEMALSYADPDSNVVSDDGMVMVAAGFDGVDYYMISEAAILGGNLINNSLAWAQLHRDYHKYERPVDEGIMNDVQTTFLSVKPTKKGATLRVPLCCGDVFYANDKIKTILGEGIVDKATFSFKDDTLTLDLLYPANVGLTNNLAPVAVNDSVTTALNTAIYINVRANDTDFEGATLTPVINAGPSHGTAVVQPDGTILYTPATGYEGDDYFNYRVKDDWGEFSNIALVAIVVNPSNAAPVAGDDTFNTNMNTALVVAAPGVFDNDSDDISFTLLSNTSPASGTLSLSGTGAFTYTPATGFVGTVSFTYTIQDGGGLTDTATVTINVINPDLPVAATDNYITRKNTNLIEGAPGVLGNDTTPTGTNVVSVTGALATVQGGTLTISADGSFTYIPPSGFVGNDSVVYTINNGTDSDTGTINIKVIPDVYVKLTEVNQFDENFPYTECPPPRPWQEHREYATYRLNFYSNSGGTTPIDVTGFGLIINIQQTDVIGTPSTPPVDTVVNVMATGTTVDVFIDFEYFAEFYDCDAVLIYYTSTAFSLLPGLYTVI